jgi:hypothetical protein
MMVGLLRSHHNGACKRAQYGPSNAQIESHTHRIGDFFNSIGHQETRRPRCRAAGLASTADSASHRPVDRFRKSAQGKRIPCSCKKIPCSFKNREFACNALKLQSNFRSAGNREFGRPAAGRCCSRQWDRRYSDGSCFTSSAASGLSAVVSRCGTLSGSGCTRRANIRSRPAVRPSACCRARRSRSRLRM